MDELHISDLEQRHHSTIEDCHTILNTLKRAIVSEGSENDAVELWAELAKAVHGWCDDRSNGMPQAFYILPQAMRDTVFSLSSSPLSTADGLLRHINTVVGVIGPENMIVLFQTHHGLRYAMEILAQCLRHGREPYHHLSRCVVTILLRLLNNKKNATGVFDCIRRILFIPFALSRSRNSETESVDTFIAAVMFHPSMEKQYDCFLSNNAAALFLGKDVIHGNKESPTVSAFIRDIDEAVSQQSDVAIVFPLLARQFVSRMIKQFSDEKQRRQLHAKQLGMQFISCLSGIVLKIPQLRGRDFEVLTELLGIIESQQLYEPTADRDTLQLQFLQRVAHVVLKSKDATMIADERRKKRKLRHDTPKSGDAVKRRLQLLRVLVRVEHRSVLPQLQELLNCICPHLDHAEVQQQLQELMERCSTVRKWAPCIAAMLAALPLHPELARFLTTSRLSLLIASGTRRLLGLETPAFLESVVVRVRSMYANKVLMVSTVGCAVLGFLDILATSVVAYETNAVAICHQLSQLVPSSLLLQTWRDEAAFVLLLKCCHSLSQAMRRCVDIHPSAVPTPLIEHIEIESFEQIGSLQKKQALSIVADCLLDRLLFIYNQQLRQQFERQEAETYSSCGEKVAEAIYHIRNKMTAEQKCVLDERLLSTFIIPWINLCKADSLIDFFEKALQASSFKKLILARFFADPTIATHQKFKRCFRSAFFRALTERLTAVDLYRRLPFVLFSSYSVKAYRRIRNVLVKSLKSTQMPKFIEDQGSCEEVLSFIEFGLETPFGFLGEDRLHVESAVILISTVSCGPKLLHCLRMFSLESLGSSADALSDYYAAVFFWLKKLLQGCFSYDILQDCKRMLLLEEVWFAVMKQILFSQWIRFGGHFFDCAPTDESDHFFRLKQLNAETLMQVLQPDDSEDVTPQIYCLQLSVVGVFVHLCTALRNVEDQRSNLCLRGSRTSSWNKGLRLLLKQHHALPDFDQLPGFLHKMLLPMLSNALALQTRMFGEDELRRWPMLAIIAGILSDITVVYAQNDHGNVRHITCKLLADIQSLVQSPAARLPKKLPVERIAYFLHHTVAVTDMNSATEEYVMQLSRLHLRLYLKGAKTRNDFPCFLQQSPSLAIISGEIEFQCDREEPWRRALLDSFALLLSNVQTASAIHIGDALLYTLQQDSCLESQFTTLQFFVVYLNALRSFLTTSYKKLPGKYFSTLYYCFWDNSFRHLLIKIANQNENSKLAFPSKSQEGTLSALLCGYFRGFTLCHTISASIAQRVTIRVMRRIKRIIESFNKRTTYTEIHAAASWFAEFSNFLISAAQHQKTTEAAQALFPSFRAALESMLSLFMVWKLKHVDETEVIMLDHVEARLGAVYSEIAACSCFADCFPDLLYSFVFTTDVLGSQESAKKKNPLATFFKSKPLTKDSAHGLVLGKIRDRVSILCASLTATQLEGLKTRLDSSRHLVEHLDLLYGLNGRYTGYDG